MYAQLISWNFQSNFTDLLIFFNPNTPVKQVTLQ